MTVNKLPAHTSNYTPCTSRTIRYIVIHYTANKGDTAKGNCNYFSSPNRKASAHYFVDDNSVWQSVLDKNRAWHCGSNTGVYYHKYCRNANSIGIEICMWDSNGKLRPKAIENAVELTRFLMDKYSIPSSNVVRHYDVTHKLCPKPMVNDYSMWCKFKADVEKKVEDLTKDETIDVIKEQDKAVEKLPVSTWAKDAWTALTNEGVTDGSSPQAPMTREQFAVMLQRLGFIGK